MSMNALTPAAADLSDPVHGWSEPDRFWTLANTSEVTPGILTALDWSVWDNFELAVRAAWCQMGIMQPKDVHLPADPNLRQTYVFYGRHALNVDYVRDFMGAVPGASPNDFERDVCGTVRPDMQDGKGSLRRVPAMLVKLPRVFRRHSGELQRSHTEMVDWWRRDVLYGVGSDDPLADLHDAASRFRDTMTLHIRTRTFLQGVQGALVGMAEKAGRADLSLTVFSAYGDVSESALADDMWALGREQLTMAEFLELHGYYGPDEGMVWTSSWREDQTPLLALARSMAARPTHEVGSRADSAREARLDAEAQLMATMGPLKQRLSRFLFSQAGRQVRNLELGKASYHIALDGCRAAARRVGADLAARGFVDDPEDVFFLTIEELGAPPAHVRELIEFRRDRRLEYHSVDLPMTFYGVPEPVPASDYDPNITEIAGIGASSGVVEGRARLATDADDDDLFEDGDILVCRITNPSWTPLFTLVEAVVIDIGSTASHGAIVARELGVPCVINTGNGTRAIRTGDRIRVNGTAGIVTVLERFAGTADRTDL
ncbi:PEP-utilizing enzyme [Rhodococcus sp. NPDC056960]|uniref:PEP-utilizing enzyme n=1 Tax=Rhodococcus sp. NPDC056960 TaxID=3345982 RepID=UPI003642131E